jgi:SAM-dependent methyltransferase
MQKDLKILVCPICKGDFDQNDLTKWVCATCGYTVDLVEGKPFFQQTPQDIIPFQKSERGPDIGTPWRQANWKFLHEQISSLSPDSRILDVGAGRGDFADILVAQNSLAVDVIPFPEVDVICDLTQCIPFRESAFDAVVLMNVLEHVYNTRDLLANISSLLKPGGKLILTIPFLLKVHFSPYDFFRYTHHSLKKLLIETGFEIQSMQGYYDPIFLMGESVRNIINYELSDKSKMQRIIIRAILLVTQAAMKLLATVLGKGRMINPDTAKSPAAIGYLLTAINPCIQEKNNG